MPFKRRDVNNRRRSCTSMGSGGQPGEHIMKKLFSSQIKSPMATSIRDTSPRFPQSCRESWVPAKHNFRSASAMAIGPRIQDDAPIQQKINVRKLDNFTAVK